MTFQFGCCVLLLTLTQLILIFLFLQVHAVDGVGVVGEEEWECTLVFPDLPNYFCCSWDYLWLKSVDEWVNVMIVVVVVIVIVNVVVFLLIDVHRVHLCHPSSLFTKSPQQIPEGKLHCTLSCDEDPESCCWCCLLFEVVLLLFEMVGEGEGVLMLSWMCNVSVSTEEDGPCLTWSIPFRREGYLSLDMFIELVHQVSPHLQVEWVIVLALEEVIRCFHNVQMASWTEEFLSSICCCWCCILISLLLVVPLLPHGDKDKPSYSTFLLVLEKNFPNVRWPKHTLLGKCDTCMRLSAELMDQNKILLKEKEKRIKTQIKEHLDLCKKERKRKLSFKN